MQQIKVLEMRCGHHAGAIERATLSADSKALATVVLGTRHVSIESSGIGAKVEAQFSSRVRGTDELRRWCGLANGASGQTLLF